MDHLVPSLKLVASGVTRLAVADYPPEKYEEFQTIAEALVQAEALGLVYKVAHERSKGRNTYGHVTQIIVAGGLTPSGKQWLKDEAEDDERRKNRVAQVQGQKPAQKQEEIIQLKPAFMGMSIDLKALWRKYVSKRGSNA